MFDDMDICRVTDMSKGVDHSDVVLMLKVAFVVFRDLVRNIAWMEAEKLVMPMTGVHGSNLLIPLVDHNLAWVGGQKFRPFCL